MQEHYTIGMDIEDDGEPLGALLLRPWVYWLKYFVAHTGLQEWR
jgi:hypothetical protein